MKEKKDNWEKLSSLSAIIASIFIPIAVVLIGNMYTSALKESETRVRYVELAVEILKEKPSGKKDNLRKWAVDLINNYSEIEIDAQTREELLKDPLFKEIDDLVIEQYAPFIVGFVLDKPNILEDFKKTINSGDKKEIKQMFTEFVVAAYQQIGKRKKQLQEPNQSNEIKAECSKSNSEVEDIYKKIEELKNKN